MNLLELKKESLNDKKRLKHSKVYKCITRVIIAMFIIFALLEGYIIAAPYTNKPVKSDVAIVLGCKVGSVFLDNRVENAYELYKKGLVKKIIVTGGKGNGFNVSEGQWEMNKLISLGMKREDIILENKSKDTFENITFAKKLMNENNFKTAILVSNKFHLRRAEILAKKQNIQVSLSGSFNNEHKGHEIYGYFREVPAIIKECIVHLI